MAEAAAIAADVAAIDAAHQPVSRAPAVAARRFEARKGKRAADDGAPAAQRRHSEASDEDEQAVRGQLRGEQMTESVGPRRWRQRRLRTTNTRTYIYME